MKLSIITINLNNASGLQKTIGSVVSQTFTDFEYIVIDGGSTDGSVDVIREYSDKITFWVSERDKGIYNAMNKGIEKANGEYCLFLNSGDWLVDDNVVYDFIDAAFKEAFVAGNMIFFNNGNLILMESVQKKDLGLNLFYNKSLPHPATFIKRELFTTFGLFNEDYKIVSDWEFFLKQLILNKSSYNHFDRNIAYFDGSGISCLQENEKVIKEEKEKVFSINFPLIYKSFKELHDEISILKLHDIDYREYLNLKNGRLGFLIRLILFLKKIKRNFLD